MKYFVTLFFAIVLVFNVNAANQWITFTSADPAIPAMSHLSTSPGDVEFTYDIPGMFVDKVEVNSRTFHNISIPGWGVNIDPGKPKVPELGHYIAVPRGAQVDVQILDDDVMVLSDYYLYPSQPLAIDNENYPQPEFTLDEAFYTQDVQYPASVVSLSDEIIIRGVASRLVRIFPIQYNPARKELTVHRHFRIHISFNGGSEYISDARLRSPYFEPLFKSTFLNYQELGPAPDFGTYSTRSNGADMIIITTTAYEAAADTLAAWKNLLGIKTVVVTTNETGNTPTQIKNFIQTAYNTWTPAPSFVIFLGDHNDVQSYYSNTGSYSHVTDLYYQKLDGNDYFPDIASGRISVSNANEALTFVKRVIKYEKNPVDDINFYTHTTHAAYFQHAGGGYAERRFAQTSEEITQHMLNNGYTAERVFYTEPSVNPTHWNNGYYSNGEPIPPHLLRSNGFMWNGNATDISNAVNTGTFFLTHRDHGGETGWGDPAYSVSHVQALQNGDKVPVVFSINCLTGRFNYSGVCFAEAWLRNPNGGGVGVVAASEVSYSGLNDGFAEGLVDAIWPGLVPLFPHNMNPTVTPHEPIYAMGLVLNQGKFRMTETWGGGNPPFNYEEYTFELFHWFGDPSMEIRTQAPQNFVISHLPTIIMGSSSFTVNIDADSARVVLTRNGEILGIALSSGGVAVVNLSNPITDPTPIQMTVYKHNYVPYLAEIQPIAATGPYLYCMSPVIVDTALNSNGVPEAGETVQMQLELTNLGIDQATNIQASITTSDTFLTILDDTTSIAAIDTADTVIAGAFEIAISPNTPHLHNASVELHMEADGGYSWDQTIFFRIREGARIVLSDSSLVFPNTFLNFTSTLPLTISNTGKDTLVITDVLSDIPQFSATPTNLMIAPNESAEISVNFVPDTTVTYNGTITIVNTDPVNFHQTFVTEGTGIYAPDIEGPDSVSQVVGPTDSLTYDVVITNTGLGDLNFNAQIAGWDPNGLEGAGGSDTFGHMWIDSDEPNGPTFDWIDIANTGTPLTLTGNNAISEMLDLGFTFTYYGQEYNQIRMCTNGWLSFTTYSVAYNNFQLPNILAPRALLAPLWDDLVFMQDSKAYFQSMGTKAVFLYQNVYRVTGEGPYTFEVVLYNNGNILFQYKELNNILADYTVGIQNHTADDGLTIAFNTPYLHDSLAVLISKHSWVSVQPMSGTIPGGQSLTLQLTFQTNNFPQGDFWASLQILSNDPDEGTFVIPIHMTVSVTGLEEEGDLAVQSFQLYQNSPNPFNPTTQITYQLPEAADVQLVVYNLLGQKVKTLVNAHQMPKTYRVTWDGTNEQGVKVASGVYIYRLKAGKHIATRKMILMK